MAKKVTKVIDEHFDLPNVTEFGPVNLNDIEPDALTKLNSTALSIVATGNKKYSVVSVKFDLDTGLSGKVEVLHKGLDMFEAQHQFKVETVKAGIFN